MFSINDYVVYGTHGVCKIVGIEEVAEEEKSYYVIRPLEKSLTIRVATNNDKVMIRPTISKGEVHRLIQAMPNVEPNWIMDAKKRSKNYRELLKTGKCSDLISIIKAIHQKNNDKSNKRKLSLQDKEFYEKAHNRLVDEFSFALKIPREDVDTYIDNYVEE